MAGIKKYDIDGVADHLQLGKHGPHLAAKDDGVEIREKGGNLASLKAAPASTDDDVVTLAQLTQTSTAAKAAIDAASATLAAELGDSKAQTSHELNVLQASLASMQTMLNKLLPAPPPSFPSAPLSIVGAPALLAAGDVPNFTGTPITPGTPVSRISGAIVSNTFHANGPGDDGVLSLSLDGTIIENFGFATGQSVHPANGVSGLKVSNVGAYPITTPGFWTSFDAQIKMSVPTTGIHEVSLAHSKAATTNTAIVVVDDLHDKPGISAGSVKEAVAGTLAYSSGVPHYGADAHLTVGFSMSNVCGEGYEPGDPVAISATPDVLSAQSFGYEAIGFALPLVRQTLSSVALKPMDVVVETPDFHGVLNIVASAGNVVGKTKQTLSPLSILAKQGSTAHVDEQAITVKIRGGMTAARVKFDTETDTPAGSPTAFDSKAAVRAVDATVVGGTLLHDQTNYAIGYLPVGPDLSQGRSGPQYATFAFSCAALSKCSISIEGSYDHCWIKLPGVAEDPTTSPVAAAVNGWWDAFQSYNGAGAPGGAGDTLNGCALGETMNGTSGTFSLTFGTATSTNATDQMVLVRLRLIAGQSITYLAFGN